MPISGSPRGVSVDGIPYNVAGDANIAQNPREETESQPHSGGNMQKVTLMPANAEGIKLILDVSEYNVLVGQTQGLDPITLTYTTRDGSVFTTTGRVTLGAYQSEDKSCEITMTSVLGKWEPFAA